MAVFSVVGMIGWNITLFFYPFAQAVWKAVKDLFPLHLCKKKTVTVKQRIFDFLACALPFLQRSWL
jgi:hypothetical protein